VGFNSRSTLVFDDVTAAQTFLESLNEEEQIISAALYDENFSIFVNYTKTGSEFMEPVLKEAGHRLYPFHVEIIQSISLDGKVVGYIYLNADWSQYNERLKLYMTVVGLILLGVISLSFFLAFRLQNIISAPLRSLATAALKISKSPDYSLRVHHDSEDELGVLFKGFNEMLSQIEIRESALGHTSAELHKREETIRTILNNAFDAIITMDSKGMITSWNKRASSIFGWEANEVIGKKLSETIVPPNYQKAHILGLKRFIATGQGQVLNQEIELTALRRSGDTFPVEISISATKSEGEYLFTGIIRDITNRKNAEISIRKSQEQLRKLSNRLESVREEEKAHLAREIHDELGQSLTVLKLDLSWMKKRLLPDQEPIVEKTKEMIQVIEDAIVTVQRISTDLRPPILDIMGICEALKWQVKEFHKRTGIECELKIEPEAIYLDDERSTMFFRIFQEALTNVARHAGASQVKSVFRQSDKKWTLEVQDNGQGMDASLVDDSKSLGLIGIRERIHLWGGVMQIDCQSGKGLKIIVNIPRADHDTSKRKNN
jgi:PAS domain S-box-containing protein